jgi:hypothetical protein
MMCQEDGEKSILGTELVEPKKGLKAARREDWALLEKGAENSLPPFSATFSQMQRFMGVSCCLTSEGSISRFKEAPVSPLRLSGTQSS